MADLRSDEAKQYRRWYGLKRWKDRRKEQLIASPLCQMCERQGLTTAATVADHIEPHRGDEDLFWFGELQSLCKQHHDSAKQFEENRGYGGEVDLAGYPLDPRHPSVTGKINREAK